MRWTSQTKAHPETVQHLQKVLNVDQNIAQLLAQRGISTFEEAKSFFRPDLDELHSPWLMKDMQLAVNRILKAIQNHEKIMIYGDYDVDGTTSVALMDRFFTQFYQNLVLYIPDRYAEGYGVSFQGIDFASENEVSLIIALDCGIKAIDKIAYAKEKNIDFIICDHHRPGNEIPDAVAVLDPKQSDCEYPYKELCGCGVGFKLAQAIQEKRGEKFEDLLPLLDLVATAIGSDIVPITGENRILASYGLQLLNTRPRAGFKAIIAQSKKKEFSITDVVFIIGPRINAAGRMKHALHAVELLIEKDEEKALKMAKDIELFNNERRTADKSITQEALLQIEENNEQKRFTSVVYQEDWHKGVIGIVASRLTETYYRPTLVFTKSGEKLAASARSVKGFDVYNALEESAEFIEQFGGHKYAAGLTLKEENYVAFKNKFEEVVKDQIDPKLLEPELNYDLCINLEDITPKFFRILKQFGPFGPGNLSPNFLIKGLKDTGYAKAVGKEMEHLKCNLFQSQTGPRMGGIGFGLGDQLKYLSNYQPVDIICCLDENEWNGNTSIQLRIKDLRPNLD
ncbi:single-stranded-DNA-specific exonuclease RecJ [Psychroflexus maritimus]|uniref:Single-stranded-DNA-specific exonuclease RecJ n=1 Tax=Psychroflexus maritimus TaxID=2714865 RepID=A0A967AGG9_9FLAO|nr:single-stranded-DNA-specific exonuclease RecJ [Psychroflexus maritimus]NGZ90808.1 single-stranded-DNA-specific exonuclease RecJ [Psychroflexus maritimus]